MADEQQNSESKTFTQAEVDAMLADAKANGVKEGQTNAHAHWQSVSDKAIHTMRQEYEGKLGQQDQTIAELRKARLESMSPEDRSTAIMEEVREMLAGQGEKPSTKPQSDDRSSQNQGDQASGQDQAAAQVAQLRKEVGEALAKEWGIDASKIDWADGEQGATATSKFFRSVLSQINTEVKESKDEDDPNKVDTSKPAGGEAFDPKTADPRDLIAKGAGTVRMGPTGEYRQAPWLN